MKPKAKSPGGDVRRRTFARFGLLWAGLLAGWIVFSQEVNPYALGLGTALSLMAAGFAYPVFYDHKERRQSRILYRLDLLLVYFVFLIYQSYRSSIELIFRMLTGRYRPGVIRIRTNLRSRIGRTMLANTISLVPGTLSLWMDGNAIYVHWFDQKSRHRIEAGRLIAQPMERLLQKIFG